MHAAASQVCASCGRQGANLGYDDAARPICPGCEADAAAAQATRKSVVQMAIGPPLLALVGTFALCLPVMNIFVPALLGLGAVVAGVSSLRWGAGASEDGVGNDSRTVLILAGAVGGLWGFGLIGLNLLGWIGFAVMG